MQQPFLIRDLVYGVSGSGKTSWWLQMAAVLAAEGKRTRWVLGDGGGTTIAMAGLGDMVEVMQYNLWDNPLETTQKLCEGGWPEDPTDPKSKILPTSNDEWEKIGLVVFEGLTVMADYIMGDRPGGLAYRMSKGEMLNSDASFKLKDGELTFGGNARTHYGFTQRRMLDLVERSRGIPAHVGWTAHERRVEDEEYRETWIGPDVCGKALTTKIGASFGNTVHLDAVRVSKKEVDPLTKKSVESLIIERRAYTRPHYDPEATHFVKYYANTRMPVGIDPNFMPEHMAPDPIAYYTRLAEARTQGMAALAKTGLTLSGGVVESFS